MIVPFLYCEKYCCKKNNVMMLKSLVNNIKNIKVPWGMSVYEEILAKVMINLVITF